MGDEGGTEAEALERAVRLLSARGRSRHDLALLLARKGFSEPIVERTLARVAELGYLDDAAFARHRAQTLLRARMGVALIRERLREQGITGQVAERALEQAQQAAGYDALAAARELLVHRGYLLPIREPKLRARAERLLASRGFPEQIVEGLLGPAPDPGAGSP